MIEFILSVLVCWFLVTCVHELSHLFIAYFVDNLKPTGFYPFWHWAKFTEEGREWRLWRPWELFKKPEGFDHFYFAGYQVEGGLPTSKDEPIHVAPLIVAAAFIATSAIYYLLNGSTFSAIMVVAFLIDAWVWFYGYVLGGPLTDGYRYRFGIQE